MSKCVYCIAMGGMHPGLCREDFPLTKEIMPLGTYENIVIKNLIEAKDRRIAELEAEVASLKDPYRIFTEWQKDQLKKLEEIKEQSATDFEEGEG